MAAAGFNLWGFLNFLADHYSPTWLILTFICVLTLFLMGVEMEIKNFPPGRRGLPWIGVVDIFFHKKTFLQHFLSTAKKYNSEVTSIRVIGKHMISLNSYEAIKEANQMPELTDRGDIVLSKVDPDYKGVIHASGDLWKVHRRFCLRSLREFGMGRAENELRILDECRHLVAHLTNHLNTPVDFGPLIRPAVNNTICGFLFGKRFEYGDVVSFDRMEELDRLMVSIVPVWKSLIYSQHLMQIPGDFFGFKESKKRLDSFYAFILEQINECKRNGDDGNSFVGAFLAERQNQLSSGQLTSFTETQLKHTIMDIFMAGTDTTATFLRWAVLCLSSYPNLQTKLHHEIVTLLGHTTAVSMKHKVNLPYTEATIMEIHRYVSISPISLPHTNLESDVRFRGYCLPKGSSVFQNIYAVHRDARHWKFPNEFNPHNFLNDEGHVQYNEHLIPFSIGKRSCVGEALARTEIFLVLVSLVQNYRFTLPDDLPKPSLEGSMNMMNYPPQFKVVITRRPRSGEHANGTNHFEE